MALPVVGASTQRLYDRLPEFYRDSDVALDYPLLRFLSLIGDQASEVETLLDRFIDGDLVQPYEADADWLLWLAQLVGVFVSGSESRGFTEPYGTLTANYATYTILDAAFTTYHDQAEQTLIAGGSGVYTDDELRAVIDSAATGWRTGSKSALKSVVAAQLTGTARVDIFTHIDGNMWKVRVVTYTAETPDPFLIPNIIVRSGVKPAGVQLDYEEYAGASYGSLSGDYGTYADLDAAFTDYAAQTAHIPV